MRDEEACSSSALKNHNSEAKKRIYLQKTRKAWISDPLFKDWLLFDEGKNILKCKWCSCVLKSKRSNLVDHSRSKKHVVAGKPFSSNRQKILDIPKNHLKYNIYVAEARNCLFVIKHGSLRSVDHLTKMNQNIFCDSEIAKNMSLSRTKCSKIVVNVLYPHFKEMLKKSMVTGPYSIIIDESTDRTIIKYLGIVVKYFDNINLKCETKFMKLQPLENSDASAITSAVLDVLKEFDLKIEIMIGIGTDNANVMTGPNSGVYKRLKDLNPRLILVPCVCHSLQLAVSAATSNTIPSDIEFMVNETYSWFSYSSLRQSQYRKLYSLINDGQNPLKIVKKCATRWLSIQVAVSRLCEQYLELKTHFALAEKNEKCSKAKILFEMYRNDINYLYLLFLKPILKQVKIVNKVFESNNVDFIKIFNDLSRLIMSLVKKVVAIPDEENYDIDDDINHEKLLAHPYLGFEVEQKIKDFKKTNDISKESEKQ